MPNIVIFGDTGAGKSSVINLIAGQKLAGTSNGALGCTFEHQSHALTIDGIKFNVWDTTGLNEGTAGTVPTAKAQRNLKSLMRELARAGGINLLIYCIFASRATSALARNYQVFYSEVCRKKVPVALVVTGLEHWENGMETWWDTQHHILRRHGMRFDEHACVTTLDLEDPVVRQRRVESQRRLRDLIVTYSKRAPWKFEKSFGNKLAPTFTGPSSATSQAPADTGKMRTIITYDMTADSPGTASLLPRATSSIGGRQYDCIRVNKRPSQHSKKLSDPVWGLLIFYTSPLERDRIRKEDGIELEKFYAIASGLMCPMIVVLRGCLDEQLAQTCWDTFTASHTDVRATPLPGSRSDSETRLSNEIERLWTDPVLDKSSGLFRSVMRKVGLGK